MINMPTYRAKQVTKFKVIKEIQGTDAKLYLAFSYPLGICRLK